MPKKVLSYEDKSYKESEDKQKLLSCLTQAFSDLKNERQNKGWNLPVQEINGLTMKLLGDGRFSLTCHRVECGTIEEVSIKESQEGLKYLKEIMTDLKKRFKKYTGMALKVKKIKEDKDVEHYAVMFADTSWQVGSSMHGGYRPRTVGKFFIRETCIYEVDLDE